MLPSTVLLPCLEEILPQSNVLLVSSQLLLGIKRTLGRTVSALRFSFPCTAGTQGLRAAPPHILRANMNIQHPIPGRAPGEYPQAPAALRGWARSPALPETLAPGPAAGAGRPSRPPIHALQAGSAGPQNGQGELPSRGRTQGLRLQSPRKKAREDERRREEGMGREDSSTQIRDPTNQTHQQSAFV